MPTICRPERTYTEIYASLRLLVAAEVELTVNEARTIFLGFIPLPADPGDEILTARNFHLTTFE